MFRVGLELGEVRKQLLVDELAQIISGQCLVMINLASLGLGNRPLPPSVLRGEDRLVGLACEFSRSFPIRL